MNTQWNWLHTWPLSRCSGRDCGASRRIKLRTLIGISVWGFLLTLGFLLPQVAGAFNINTFPTLNWGLNDSKVNVLGFVIEDFEDVTLVPGLQVHVTTDSGAAYGPTTTLPFLVNPVTDDPNAARFFANGVWDGARVLLNRASPIPSGSYGPANSYGDVTFQIAGGAAAFGFSIQQAGLNIVVRVNGGTGTTLSIANGSSPYRNGYVRIDAGADETITSVTIENGVGDGWALDHVAFLPVADRQVTLTSFDASVWPRTDATIGVVGYTIEDFEDRTLLPGLQVELSDVAVPYGPSSSLPPGHPLADIGSFFTVGAWDGTLKVQNRVSSYGGSGLDLLWADIGFSFSGGTRSVGFSLQDMQYIDGLEVNGVSVAVLNGVLPTSGARNGYLRIDALPGKTIQSFRIANGVSGSSGDGVTLDHLAILNAAPSSSQPITDQSTSYGSDFTFQLPADSFVDPDPGQTLSYSVSGLPSWLSFDAGTRTFHGVPIEVGSFPLMVTATDNGTPPMSGTTAFTLQVAKAVLQVEVDSVSRPFGQANPPLVIHYGEFRLNESPADLDIPPTATSLAAGQSPAGVYPIHVDLGGDDHYSAVLVGTPTLAITATTPVCSGCVAANSLVNLAEGTGNPFPAAGRSELVEGIDGYLYGIAEAGGTLPNGDQGAGILFRVARDGSGLTVLHVFGGPNALASPISLVRAADGTLFGLAFAYYNSGGGLLSGGGLFKFDPVAGACSVLQLFADADPSVGKLLMGSDGILYGSRIGGGSVGEGYLFACRVDASLFPNGSSFMAITPFGRSPGEAYSPVGRLAEVDLAGERWFYGATQKGGALDAGVLFRVRPDGSEFQVLFAFGEEEHGAEPEIGLLLATDGNLYGATGLETGNFASTVFRFNPADGTLTTIAMLISQGFNTATHPVDLVERCGALVGVTSPDSEPGKVYQLSFDGSSYSVLWDFEQLGGSFAAKPKALLVGSDGILYGTASETSNLFTVRKIPNQAPLLTTPSSPVTATVGVPFELNLVASDADSGQTLSYVAVGLPPGLGIEVGAATQQPHVVGIPASEGTYSATVTVTDNCTDPLSHSVTFDVVVILGPDVLPPNLHCPADVTVQCEGEIPAPNFAGGTVSDDRDPNPIWSHLGDSAEGSNPKIVTRTYQASDASGNLATCSQLITVRDTTSPLVTCPGELIVTTDPGVCSIAVNYPAPTIVENCQVGTVTFNPPSGTVFTRGTHSVVCTVTDVAGNMGSCTFSVQVYGPESPGTSIVKGPSVVSADPFAEFEFVGADNVTGISPLTFECSLDGGPFVPCVSPHSVAGLTAGQHTWQVRAIDILGRHDPFPATWMWRVDFSAVTPLDAALPFEDGLEDDSHWGLFEEIVGGNACYGRGYGQVAVSSEFARSGSKSLAVWANADGSPKSNHLLANRQLSTAGVSGTMRFETYALIDPSSATTSQTGPEFSMQNTRDVNPGGFATTTAGFQYVANPGVSPDWKIWSQQSPGVAGWESIHTEALTPGVWYHFVLVADFRINRYVSLVVEGPGLSQTIDLSSYLIAEESKFQETAFWITLEAENLWNNCCSAGMFRSKMYYDDISCTSIDTLPPIIDTCPGERILSAGVLCQAALPDLTGELLASDDSGVFSVTQSPAPGTSLGLGMHPIAFLVRDAAGNESSCATSVSVQDTVGPVVTLVGVNPLVVECHTAFSDPGATAMDACAGSVPVTVSGTVNANVPGSYTLTYTAVDGNGNTTPLTRTVEVRDTIGPVVTLVGVNPLVVECHTAFSDPGATAMDACAGSVPVTVSGTVNASVPGSYTLTYTAVDGNGNTTPVTRTVEVRDTIGPVIVCPADITVTSASGGGMIVNYPSVTAVDACGGSRPVVAAPPSGSVFPVGTTVVQCSSSDANGNQGSCSFRVTVTSSVATTRTFANPQVILLPDSTGTPRAAGTYPSRTRVSGMAGVVTRVTATLSGLVHTFPDDLDILLVAPNGQRSLLMSDAGGGADVFNVNLTFSNAAPVIVPDGGPLVSRTYAPANFGSGDTFPAPAPAGPYAANLGLFTGINPNGDWLLYIVDDTRGDLGLISGGWSLTITSSPGLADLASDPDDSSSAGVSLDSEEKSPDKPAGRELEIRFLSPVGDQLHIGVQGLAGRTGQLQASTDLKSWSTVATIASSGSEDTLVTLESANGAYQFYRVRILGE